MGRILLSMLLSVLLRCWEEAVRTRSRTDVARVHWAVSRLTQRCPGAGRGANVGQSHHRSVIPAGVGIEAHQGKGSHLQQSCMALSCSRSPEKRCAH